MIKMGNSEHLSMANESVTTWYVGGKEYYEFNLKGLYFSLYDNKEMSGKPIKEKEYIEKDWNSFSEFEEKWTMEVRDFLETLENKITFSPEVYFEKIKNSKMTTDDEMLKNSYNAFCVLMEKAISNGQISAANKLMFHMETIEKERELIKIGINSFIYKSEIEKFVENVEGKVIKIIELKNYEREIPDEICDAITKTKSIFSEFYVLFTDYTGEEERRIEKEKRSKDPILFGVFRDERSRAVVDRFYVIGDWEDEYCDLTLEKMLTVIGKEKEFEVRTPKSIDEFREDLKRMKLNDTNTLAGANFLMDYNYANALSSVPSKKSFFEKIRSFVKK